MLEVLGSVLHSAHEERRRNTAGLKTSWESGTHLGSPKLGLNLITSVQQEGPEEL